MKGADLKSAKSREVGEQVPDATEKRVQSPLTSANFGHLILLCSGKRKHRLNEELFIHITVPYTDPDILSIYVL